MLIFESWKIPGKVSQTEKVRKPCFECYLTNRTKINLLHYHVCWEIMPRNRNI